MKIKKTVKSNRSKFNTYANNGLSRSLHEMGSVGVGNIVNLTPVVSGRLKGSNRSDVEGNSVIFSNNTSYAPYVELGTRHQSAQSFIRRGINNSLSRFTQIIISNLGV